jgi:Recombination endonuclease VII
MAEPSKCCSQCGMLKPLSEFHRMATGRDGHRAECAACSCERARCSYKPRDTGLLSLTCRQCGHEFEYVKTSGRRRFYCSDRCKFQAGETAKKQRAAVEIRTCACGSVDVGRVGKPVCAACRKDPRDSETLRIRERRRTLRLYNLSEAKWLELLARQDSRCAICHVTDPGGRGQWMIDHDHRCCPGTGSCGQCVRGLLCNRCNLMLGYASDQPERLRAALEYLSKTVVKLDQ